MKQLFIAAAGVTRVGSKKDKESSGSGKNKTGGMTSRERNSADLPQPPPAGGFGGGK